MSARGECNVVHQNKPTGTRDGGYRVWWRWARAKGWDGVGYVARAWLRVRDVRDPSNDVNRRERMCWDGSGYVARAWFRVREWLRGDRPVQDPGNDVNRDFNDDAPEGVDERL